MEGGRDVKIVALSASVLAAEREAILAAGFDESLRKPVRREEIFDCLARHLNVRFVYQEAPSPHSAEPVRVQRTDLSILPVRLRQELADAVVSLNPSRIQEVIARVADHDAPSGEFLSFTAKRLAYTEILKALEESGIRLREQAW